MFQIGFFFFKIVVMKAAQINEYGGVEVITINDTDKPVLGSGQVLVDVHAASLNPFDSAVREGKMREMKQLDFPSTLGGDLAGVVYNVGDGITGLSAGDNVYGQASVFGGASGALAEFAATLASQIAKMPGGLSFEQAAALPLTGAAALQALDQHLQIQKGQRLLIQGGSGGIGTIAIQVAKHLGAYVAATVPPAGVDYAKEQGADEVIDYKSQDFTKLVSGYDAVLDLVGGEVLEKSIDCLNPGGKAVSTVSQADVQHAKERGIATIYQGTEVTAQKLDKLRGLAEQGVVNVNVDKVFTLDDTAHAFKYRETNVILGKVVIKIK